MNMDDIMDVQPSAYVVEEKIKEYEELFKYRYSNFYAKQSIIMIIYFIRYTMRDPDYRITTERANNPAPPPDMSKNWPSMQRGRRRDWHWYIM